MTYGCVLEVCIVRIVRHSNILFRVYEDTLEGVSEIGNPWQRVRFLRLQNVRCTWAFQKYRNCRGCIEAAPQVIVRIPTGGYPPS